MFVRVDWYRLAMNIISCFHLFSPLTSLVSVGCRGSATSSLSWSVFLSGSRNSVCPIHTPPHTTRTRRCHKRYLHFYLFFFCIFPATSLCAVQPRSTEDKIFLYNVNFKTWNQLCVFSSLCVIRRRQWRVGGAMGMEWIRFSALRKARSDSTRSCWKNAPPTARTRLVGLEILLIYFLAHQFWPFPRTARERDA